MWRRRLGADGRSRPCTPGHRPPSTSHTCPLTRSFDIIPAHVELDAVSSPNWQRHLPQTLGLMRRSSPAAACLCSHVHAHPNYRSLEATRVLHDVSGTKVNVLHLCTSPNEQHTNIFDCWFQRCLLNLGLSWLGGGVQSFLAPEAQL